MKMKTSTICNSFPLESQEWLVQLSISKSGTALKEDVEYRMIVSAASLIYMTTDRRLTLKPTRCLRKTAKSSHNEQTHEKQQKKKKNCNENTEINEAALWAMPMKCIKMSTTKAILRFLGQPSAKRVDGQPREWTNKRMANMLVKKMMCYAMPCYAMPCYAMLCYEWESRWSIHTSA